MFLFSIITKAALGRTLPPVQRVLRAISPGVKRQKRRSNHSAPSGSEVQNDGAIPPLHIRPHDVVLN
jgi:hypothetical protein